MDEQRKRSELSVPYLFLYGCITGVICGGLLALFLTCARIVLSFSFGLYSVCDTPLMIVCIVTLALICCLLTAVLQTLCPSCKGSGVPLAEGCARGMLRVKWLSTAAALIAGSLLSFVCGMPLGSEGPSIGVGGLVGDGIGRTAKKPVEFRRYLITGGASAGLAVAFNAPLTGIAFALEETHRRFSPSIILAACSSVISAVIVSQAAFYGFGHIPYLNELGIRAGFVALPFLSQSQITSPRDWALLSAIAVVCGLVCGGFAICFNTAILSLNKLFSRVKSATLRLAPAFCIMLIFGLSLRNSVGSGEAVLESVSHNTEFWLLLALLLARFIMTVVASGASATGGLFLPMIAIGGLIGTITAKTCILCGMPGIYAPNIVMLCISAYFAASVRAPISAVALSLELTASFSNLLPCVIAVGAAMIIAGLTRTPPLYERMMENLQSAAPLPAGSKNITVRGVVGIGSPVCKKRIRDILWPYNSLVTELDRNGEEIVPDGETTLLAGDRLTVRAERVDPEFFDSQMREYITTDDA